MTRWERSVPVYGVPVLTRGFWALLALIVVGLILTAIREVVGIGGVMSGMSDPFAWGLWKTFNVMVLTGLGSGGFAVGIAAWVFNNKKLHSVMRVALLTSFLAYSTGLAMLGVDVGRPWNFYWVAWLPTWNLHSPLLEIAVCMSLYASVPLFLENLPPLFEYLIYEHPKWRGFALGCEKAMRSVYPFIVGLAYILPIMHQSSLGALMILGGNRVNTLWQTPFLDLRLGGGVPGIQLRCALPAAGQTRVEARSGPKRPVGAEQADGLDCVLMDGFPILGHSVPRKDSPCVHRWLPLYPVLG